LQRFASVVAKHTFGAPGDDFNDRRPSVNSFRSDNHAAG
jgi:hypothetical protein